MVTDYPPLCDAIPYRGFLGGGGLVDLRDEGILKGLWLTGPSPDVADDAELLRRSEQSRQVGHSLT